MLHNEQAATYQGHASPEQMSQRLVKMKFKKAEHFSPSFLLIYLALMYSLGLTSGLIGQRDLYTEINIGYYGGLVTHSSHKVKNKK